MKQPLVNIIILTHNQFDFIDDCIKAILNCNYKNLKIFLVDNASDKNKYLPFHERYKNHKNIISMRLEKNIGFSGGCNYALKRIKKGYIVFLNDDSIVSKDWLLPIISYMENNPDVGAVQPKIKNMRNKDYFEYAGAGGGYMDVYGYPFCRGRVFFTIEKDRKQYDDLTDVVWTSGNCMITRADVIKKIGMFDEIFFIYGEESDLCWRMHFAGYRLVYFPDSTVYHYGAGTMQKQGSRNIFLHHRNGLILLFKNYTFSELLRYIPIRVILDFVSFWYYLLHDKIPANSLALVYSYLNIIYLTPQILKRRNSAAFKKNKNIRKYPLYKRSIIFDYFLLKKTKFNQLNYRYG